MQKCRNVTNQPETVDACGLVAPETTKRRRRCAAASPILVLGLVAIPLWAFPATAQTTAQSPRLSLQTGEGQGLISKDAFGKPCLDIEAASRALLSNPNVYNHLISVQNRCLKPLRFKVCYHGSDRCTDMDVPGKKRKDAVLGVGGKTFRFVYKEVR